MKYAIDSEYSTLRLERQQLKARLTQLDAQMQHRTMQARQAERISFNRLLDAARALPEDSYDESSDREYQTHKRAFDEARARLAEVEKTISTFDGQEG